MHLAHKLTVAIALASAISLVGCGGSAPTAVNNDSDNSSSNNISFDLSGIAIKGVMMGADIQVYELDTGDLLYSTTTDSNGRYSLSGITTNAEVLKVVMTTSSSTTTRCDSAVGCENATYEFAETYAFNDPDFELTALLPNPGESDASLSVTLLTHMATKRAEDEGATSEDEIQAVNEATAALFGLAGIDIATTEPADISSSDSASASTGASKYGAILAGFATVAAQKGKNITEAIKEVTDAYVANHGLSGNSSDDNEIDLADLFAAAVDAIDAAERTLGIDISNAVEVVLIAKQQEMASLETDEDSEADLDATEEDSTEEDASEEDSSEEDSSEEDSSEEDSSEEDASEEDSSEEDSSDDNAVEDDAEETVPEEVLTELDQATVKGIALLETLNDWNDTLVDAGEQITDPESALANHADYLASAANSIAEYSEVVAQAQILALDTSGVMYGFAELSMAIGDNFDDLELDYDQATGRYSFSMSASEDSDFFDANDLAFPFFYGDQKLPMSSSGTLSISFKYSALLGYVTEISYSGTSSRFALNTETVTQPLTLNSLNMGLSYTLFDPFNTSANTGSIGFSELSMHQPAGYNMQAQYSSIPVTLGGSGSLSGSINNINRLTALLGSENNDSSLASTDGNLALVLNLTLAEEASGSATGSLDLALTTSNSSEDGASVDINLALNLDNGIGETIQGSLVGDYSAATPEDADMTFTGTISSTIDDAESEFDGANASFQGSLVLNGVSMSDDETLRSITAALNGNINMTAPNGASLGFDGQASVTAESFATADGSTWYNYLYYYQWEDTHYDAELEQWVVDDAGSYTESPIHFIPTQASLSGSLSSVSSEGETASAKLSATLLIEDLDTVIADLKQFQGGQALGTIAPFSSYQTRTVASENRIYFTLSVQSFDDLSSEVADLLAEYGIQSDLIYEENYWRTEDFGLGLLEGCFQEQGSTHWYCPVSYYQGSLMQTRSDLRDYDGDSYWGTDDLGDLKLTDEQYQAGIHLDPDLWLSLVINQGLADEAKGAGYNIHLGEDQGALKLEAEKLSVPADTSEFELTVTYAEWTPDALAQIAALETETSFVDAAVHIAIDLDVWGYDDASIELTLDRTSQDAANGQLELLYGNRAVTIVADITDEQLSDSSKITISDGDTSMVITATCVSDAEGTTIATCDSADLDFAGVISVDDQEIGTLEVRDDVPVFVFGERGSYEVLVTPSFLVTQQ